MKVRKMCILFLLLLAIVVYAWLATHYFGAVNIDHVRLLSNLVATLGLVFIFTQFVLSSRIKAIETGFGLDKMLKYHRTFGRIGLSLVFSHFLLTLFWQWRSFGDLFISAYMLWGLIALIGFTITAGLAATYKRLGIVYEIWKNIHLLNYVLFPVAITHALLMARVGSLLFALWILLISCFVIMVAHRVYHLYRVWKNPFTVVEVKQEADDVWSLFFKGNKFSYLPGQFMLVQLLRNGQRSAFHPFTISSSPIQELISITPKELGDFTSTIKDTQVGDKAFIDAPYGVFTFLNENPDELVFIAGGIGITPFLSMLRYIADKQLKKKVTLFWANRSQRNVCFQTELAEMQRKLHNFTLVMVMSEQKDWEGEQGFVTGDLLQRHLPTLKGIHFFICGPPPMLKALKADLRRLNVPRRMIVYESFEL